MIRALTARSSTRSTHSKSSSMESDSPPSPIADLRLILRLWKLTETWRSTPSRSTTLQESKSKDTVSMNVV
ncbi:hypothetical protein OESDEN_02481 [Oesophagostomum dentatum]|uniref:Uncharacterized protein n=1 Tax=Oesophagostomum dentatum TaxID=61180 RepID=A0A0B1TN77_OESDE|nr:hypothetical protein OESDEN_02481 [Oesophagostomum dentatum]